MYTLWSNPERERQSQVLTSALRECECRANWWRSRNPRHCRGTESEREREREGEGNRQQSFPIFTSGTAHCDTCVNMHEN